MIGGKFEVRTLPAGRLEIELHGAFDKELAGQLEQRLHSSSATETRHVFFDLCGLVSCDIRARSILIEIHKRLKGEQTRIAYLADSSLMRGLALWLCHLSDDGNSKPFGTKEQAEAWLVGSDSRVDATHKSFVKASTDLGSKKVRS